MPLRLLKLGERAQLLALGLVTLSGLALGSACAGKKFTAQPGSSESGNGSGGANAGGDGTGEAGASGSAEGGSSGASAGENGGDGASAGSAGKPPVACDCRAGEYCQDGTVNCRKCADFSRLEFGTAQKLNTLAQTPQNAERFARPAGNVGSQLFYVSGAPDKAKILYAAAPMSGVGVPVTLLTQVESGPLLVNGYTDQNLFFDRLQAGGRKLMMASWSAPAIVMNEAFVPEPINASGVDDYSIAISPGTGHVYWMSTRSGKPELFWLPTSMSPPPDPAVLDLKIKAGKNECPRSGDDATPWVNTAGSVLFFRNPSVNDNCQANDAGATDLFAAPLNSDGTVKAAATALSSLNVTGGASRETDPSLSPDSCTIYFATDNGSGDFDLYKAQRK